MKKQINRPPVKGGIHNILDWDSKKVEGKHPVILCPKCGAVYYDKHWHTDKEYSSFLRKQKRTAKEFCPECKFTSRQEVCYEGEVILKNLPGGREKTEILNLVENISDRAVKRDPEDRIIKIEDNGKTVRILTTENQLAASIGKQINSAFKGGKLTIKWNESDQTARVVWEAGK